MKIRYSVDLEDIHVFVNYCIRTSPSWKGQRLYFVFAMTMASAVMGLVVFLWKGISALFVGLVAAYLCMVLFSWRNYGSASLKRVKVLYPAAENRGMFGEHDLMLNEDGLLETADVGQSKTSFDGILRIVKTPFYVYIFTGSHMAYVIPRGKVLEGDLDAFVAALEAKLPARSE